jgi:hypothetical protein
MIDWVFVGLNALWILGLSLALATLSLALYNASDQNKKLSEVLKRKGYSLFLDLSMILLCLGLFGLLDAWWERLLWGVLALGSITSLWLDTHRKATPKHG